MGKMIEAIKPEMGNAKSKIQEPRSPVIEKLERSPANNKLSNTAPFSTELRAIVNHIIEYLGEELKVHRFKKDVSSGREEGIAAIVLEVDKGRQAMTRQKQLGEHDTSRTQVKGDLIDVD